MNHQKEHERGAQINIPRSRKPINSVSTSEVPLRLRIRSNNSSRRDVTVRVNMGTVKAETISLFVCRYISWFGGGGSDLELSSIWIINIGVKASTEGQEVPTHLKRGFHADMSVYTSCSILRPCH
jgi:hypothetical protein